MPVAVWFIQLVAILGVNPIATVDGLSVYSSGGRAIIKVAPFPDEATCKTKLAALIATPPAIQIGVDPTHQIGIDANNQPIYAPVYADYTVDSALSGCNYGGMRMPGDLP